MNASELFVACLKNEGIETIYGIPGEENIDLMDALLDSGIEFVLTRHEQAAAFMADVHGRLTGKAGVCLATLGPGACNLITGVADANMDRAPLVAIAGQADTGRMHKESHQHLDLVALFDPVSKYSVQVREAAIIPEVIRKAFKMAQMEKPGVSFIELPENVAEEEISDRMPLRVQQPMEPDPAPYKVRAAAEVLARASSPIVLAGNGVIRANASKSLVAFAERLNIPVATTFMAKGAIPASHPLSLGTIGLQARDYVASGFESADVIVCAGYDMVEYAPQHWHPTKDRKILHLDSSPAEVDEHYIVAAGLLGDVGRSLDAIAELVPPCKDASVAELKGIIDRNLSSHAEDVGFPIKPQKIIWDLRQALDSKDIVISDVGAHKMWMARLYPAEAPNTCIISNGFASMGIGLPGAIAAKRVFPDRKSVTVTGDAGFLMNAQELETAVRLGTPIVVLVWRDDKYGLIEWHQLKKFGRPSHIAFGNPDFVQLAASFGARGYRVGRADELGSILKEALESDTVAVIDCPVDYSENMKLTEELGQLQCRS
ncbi:MAG: acetolactate synthase large subunit [Planctomycetota bacterium]|jgi:acetolactate synthase-1/2/3 large subunit